MRVTAGHTNVVYLAKNGKVLLDRSTDQLEETYCSDRSVLNIRDIVYFAETTDLGILKPIFRPQMTLNMAIADEGMKHRYGSNIGKIMRMLDDSAAGEAAAYAAAAPTPE